MKRKIVSILLAAVMLCTLLPQMALFAFAEGEEKTVQSITFTPAKPIEVIENANGYWRTDGNEQKYFHYYTSQFLSKEKGNKLTVKYTDGSTDEFINSKYTWNYVNADGKTINISESDEQYDKHWTLGSDNFFIVRYNDEVSTTVPVTVVENPVASIEYVPATPLTVIENYKGYSRGDWFEYDLPSFNIGDKLIVSYKNGEKAEFVAGYKTGYFVWSTADGKDFEYPPSIDADQKTKHWTLGGDNTATLTYMGVSTQVSVTVAENPVASVEYKPVKPVTVIENYDGYERGDGSYIYDTPSFRAGDKFVVTFKDGKKAEYSAVRTSWRDLYYSGYDITFVDSEGKSVEHQPSLDSDQYDAPWTKGGENRMTFTYLGVASQVPVAVIENPVASIEFEFASPVVIYENEGGNYSDREEQYTLYKDEKGYYYNKYSEDGKSEKVYVETDEVFFEYSYIPIYKEGSKLTVHYKDGTTKVLTHRFFFSDEYEGYYFVDENGEPDDYDVTFRWEITYDKQFKVGSDNYLTVSYIDVETQAPVTVVPNPVDRIEYSSFAPITFNVDDKKEYNDSAYGEGVFDTNKLFKTGNTLKVYFKDGKTQTFTFYYRMPGVEYNPVVGGYYYAIDETGTVMNYRGFDYDYVPEDWEVGKTYELNMSYFGAETKVPVTIISDKIDPPFSFKDVTKDAFYASSVNWAVENNITNGTGEGTFSPNNKCTRGQVVTFLWRAEGCPIPTNKTNPFTDVKENSFCYDAVLWAVEKGVTKGLTDTTFGPGKECTRGQVVTFLWRAKNSPAPTNTKHPFNDVKSDGFYYKAMLWAVEKEVTNGTTATTFGPNKTCTRGQVVTFLYRSFK